VKFYILVGFLYFLVGEVRALPILTMLAVIAFLGKHFALASVNSLSHFLDASYFGWFAIGGWLFSATGQQN
jgi:hypothetical protein